MAPMPDDLPTPFDPVPANPLQVAADWLAQAWQERRQPNPNAIVLATCTQDGHPSARVVLCKEIVPTPGYLVFYTNYRSRKANELAANPRAAAVLHWDHLQKQVRIDGPVVLAPAADSDAYFASRALESRIGAWASQQSRPIGSRAELLANVDAAASRFGIVLHSGAGRLRAQGTTSATDGPEAVAPGSAPVVPRPPHWGGYRLWADEVELWMQGDARIHDRMRWRRVLTPRGHDDFTAGPWTATRLQP
jgi:pyridoxamine 5'-phosphate oxidase